MSYQVWSPHYFGILLGEANSRSTLSCQWCLVLRITCKAAAVSSLNSLLSGAGILSSVLLCCANFFMIIDYEKVVVSYLTLVLSPEWTNVPLFKAQEWMEESRRMPCGSEHFEASSSTITSAHSDCFWWPATQASLAMSRHDEERERKMSS